MSGISPGFPMAYPVREKSLVVALGLLPAIFGPVIRLKAGRTGAASYPECKRHFLFVFWVHADQMLVHRLRIHQHDPGHDDHSFVFLIRQRF